MTEVWKPIPGHPGYEASDLGRVRSLDRRVRCGRNGNGRRLVKGRVLRPGRMTSGHLSVALGKGNSVCVHRAVAEAFFGPCPEGHEVLHRDGDPGNNRLSNLRWGTRSQNNRDATKHGRRKLTQAQADNCVRRWLRGASQTALAREHSVSVAHMSKIVKRQAYVDL